MRAVTSHPSTTGLRPYAQDERGGIGLTILLGSWTMLFAALLFGYVSLRARSGIWPPPEVPTLSPLLPALNTGVLLVSSLALHFGARKLALVFGALFFLGQVVAWSTLTAAGVTPAAGPYASAVFGLTLAHAAHAFVGLIGLAIGTHRRGWALYWHYMAAVWLILFAALFLL